MRIAKCRYCEWNCPVEGRMKFGKKYNPWWKLREHLVEDHPGEMGTVLGWLERISTPEVCLRSNFFYGR